MPLLVPTLRTARLVLRPLDPTDVPAFAALNAHPEVTRFLSADGQPLAAEDAWRQLAMFVGHWQLRGFGMWALAEVAQPAQLIGRAGLHQPEGWPDVEVGWALAPAYWGRGYATEAASAVIAYAFETLNLPRVVSLIHPSNIPSRAVAERMGERRAGAWTHRGQRVDLYTIDQATWRARRAASR